MTAPIAMYPLARAFNRWELAAGWFATPHILVKGGYVTQVYEGFPPTDIRNGGKFNGAMMEGVVAS